VQRDLIQVGLLGRLLRIVFVKIKVLKIQVSQASLDRPVEVDRSILTVDQHPVQLEVEAVIETATDVPTPMEEETVEGLGHEQFADEIISPIVWQDVEDLVNEPDDSSC